MNTIFFKPQCVTQLPIYCDVCCPWEVCTSFHLFSDCILTQLLCVYHQPSQSSGASTGNQSHREVQYFNEYTARSHYSQDQYCTIAMVKQRWNCKLIKDIYITLGTSFGLPLWVPWRELTVERDSILLCYWTLVFHLWTWIKFFVDCVSFACVINQLNNMWFNFAWNKPADFQVIVSKRHG